MKSLTTSNLLFGATLCALIRRGVSIGASSTATAETQSRTISAGYQEEYSRLVSHVLAHLKGIHNSLASVRQDVRRGTSDLDSEIKRQMDSMKDTIFTEYTSKNDARRRAFEARMDDSNYERLVNQIITHITGINSGMESIRLEVKNYTALLDAERKNEIETVKSEIAEMKQMVLQMQEATEDMKQQGLESFKSEIKTLIVEKNEEMKLDLAALKETMNLIVEQKSKSELKSVEQNVHILDQLAEAKVDLIGLQHSLNHSDVEINTLSANLEEQSGQIQFLKTITLNANDEALARFGRISELNSSMSAGFEAISRNIQELKSNYSTVTTGLGKIQETFAIHSDVFQNIVRSKDCCSIQRSGYVHSGIYAIYPFKNDRNRNVKVYCDLTTNGGGWTVIQRREEVMGPEVDFNRDWAAYEGGFGNLSYSFWLGLPYISALTENRKQSLRVEMTDWENLSKYAMYESFKVADSSSLYQLTVSGHSGSAGDSLMTAYASYNSSGMPFSTKNRDNDRSSDNCAANYHGGWWFNERSHVNPNGVYKANGEHALGENGVFWHDFKNSLFYSVKRIEMKLRPESYSNSCKF